MSTNEPHDPSFGPEPADMLPPVFNFVGRSEELVELRGLLADARATAAHRRPARVGVYGDAGVGKSALGMCFAGLIKSDYPDGILYQDLKNVQLTHGQVDVPQVLRSFLDALGKGPDTIPHDTGRLRGEFVNATNNKRLIVFLDNVRNYPSVNELIPESRSCIVLLTSREHLDEQVRSLLLEPLPDADATELFCTIAPSRVPGDAAEGVLLGELLKACERLPIAIEVLATRLRDQPAYTVPRLLADLDRYKSRLTGLFGAKRNAIETSFRVSYDALSEDQAMLFRRLGVVPGESFDIGLAAYLGGMSVDSARLVLEELNQLRLIRSTQDPDYFTMHSLWQAFTKDQLGDKEAAKQLRRTLTFYCEQAENTDCVIHSLPQPHDALWSGGAGRRIPPQRDPAAERDRALDWLEKQYRNLVAGVKRACEENKPDLAWRTCHAMLGFFEIRGKWDGWEQTHVAAIRIVPGRSLGMAHLHYGLARLNAARRVWEPAIDQYRRAVAIFRLQGEQVQVGRSLNAMGDAYRYMRNWDAAENCFKRSLEILEEAHSPHQVAIAKRSMSTIHRQRGEFDEAMGLCQAALDTLEREENRDERWIAAIKLSLADIYLDSGTYDARALLEECLEVFIKLEDSHWILLARRSLGEALRVDEDYAAALFQLELCQEALRRTRDDHWSGQILHSMGLVYLDQGDTEQAGRLFHEALAKFRESRDTLWQGRTQVSLGKTAAKDGRVADARMAYQEAWPLFVEQGAREDLLRLEEALDRTGRQVRGSAEPAAAADGEAH